MYMVSTSKKWQRVVNSLFVNKEISGQLSVDQQKSKHDNTYFDDTCKTCI